MNLNSVRTWTAIGTAGLIGVAAGTLGTTALLGDEPPAGARAASTLGGGVALVAGLGASYIVPHKLNLGGTAAACGVALLGLGAIIGTAINVSGQQHPHW